MDESFLKNLNILYVEDELEIIELVEKRFASKFNQFLSVTSAEEAVEVYRNNNIDLVLTDYILPGMNGMEFAKEILKIKGKVPIILITGYVDMQFLVEAINMGITQFVAKPIQFKLLRNSINNAVESVVLEHILNKSREQELELLKYKDMYNTMQHDATLKKELHLMRNDLFKKYLYQGSTPFTRQGWQLEVFYKSLDTVSGDAYTCRQLNNGNLLIFIADAMGKGVSASVTSLVSVSIVNYAIKEHFNRENISAEEDLRCIVEGCADFMRNNLLEDEVLCGTFAYFDFINDKFLYSSFSMPRILYQTKDGKIEKLPSNNLPIMHYPMDIKITEVELSNIDKIALFTDGILETVTPDGSLYSEYLNDNFEKSPLLKGFMENVYEKIDAFDDDSTVFFMRRPFAEIISSSYFTIPTVYDKLDDASDNIRKLMNKDNINIDNYDPFFTALSECIMNAYEHGNLAVTSDIKHELIKNGSYEEELLKKEKECDRVIGIGYNLCRDKENRYLIVSIKDEGEGYPKSVFNNSTRDATKYNGRGVKIIDYYTDIFFFSEDRKEIFIGVKVN